MDYIKELHEMCETISDAISEANEKIRSAGGKLTAGDVDYVDKLTHALKSVKATIAMMEDEGEYSGYYPMYTYAGNRGGQMGNRSYRGGSYARGRGRNARRDSMGRYSSEGYSRAEGLAEELRELAEDAPNESVKREMHRLVEKIEQMQ